MPLSGISRRDTALGAFTFRELVTQRRLAERAIARRRDAAAARALIARIDDELAARRGGKLDRAGRALEP
ncbi:hypothetical protein [Acuticoccus sp.]|uniref:hypothetical protein n=1 Tax=Acuticoccus sp. TaxID=1904378 RepID=UPI003B5288C2